MKAHLLVVSLLLLCHLWCDCDHLSVHPCLAGWEITAQVSHYSLPWEVWAGKVDVSCTASQRKTLSSSRQTESEEGCCTLGLCKLVDSLGGYYQHLQCPFHGPIVPRDEQGNPVTPSSPPTASSTITKTTSSSITGLSTPTITEADYKDIEAAVFAAKGKGKKNRPKQTLVCTILVNIYI